MLDPKFFDDLAKCLSKTLPPALKDMQAEWEKNIRSLLQSAFAKLDLVTREEFDAQANVLIRTREKMETLQKQVSKLEKQLKAPKKKKPEK